jgi:hypothetical protein
VFDAHIGNFNLFSRYTLPGMLLFNPGETDCIGEICSDVG